MEKSCTFALSPDPVSGLCLARLSAMVEKPGKQFAAISSIANQDVATSPKDTN
jgi:hypothetical protein